MVTEEAQGDEEEAAPPSDDSPGSEQADESAVVEAPEVDGRSLADDNEQDDGDEEVALSVPDTDDHAAKEEGVDLFSDEESELPPMPVPPPARRRTMTTRPIVLPPMPEVPGNVVTSSNAAQEAPETSKAIDSPQVDPGETPQPAPSSTVNSVSLKRLVTPDQGSDFYENAFRELEVLQRDLLERGAWEAALERVKALNIDADALTEALGPAARSGDERFGAALRKVELVRSYLVRIQSICDGAITTDETTEAPPSNAKKRGRITRILSREPDND